ncbi:hypothetical protein DFH09DRAFT_1320023 [Mycena vulgaris]|nr:hypothetical protein DFH09DRAFT_1320023 [Mycena vulgaris]
MSRMPQNAFLAAGIRSTYVSADSILPAQRAQLRPVLNAAIRTAISLDQPGTQHTRFQNIDFVFTDPVFIEMHDSALVVKSTNGDPIFAVYTHVDLFDTIRTTFHNVDLSFAANATMINSEGPSGQSLVVEDPNGNFIFAAVAAA